MKIARVEYFTAVAPLKRPAEIAYGRMTAQTPVIVKLTTNDGVVGFGEVPGGGVLNYGGYTQEGTIMNIRENFEHKLVGADPTNIARINDALSHPITRSQEEREVQAKAAIDLALHDLIGRILGIPVHTILGGRFRDHVEFGDTLYLESPEKAAETAERLAEDGCKSFKIKAGLDPDEDVKRLKAMREVVGDKVCFWIDPNEQWTARRSIEVIKRLQRFGLEYVEQPTPGWDIEALVEVRRAVTPDVKVIADQSIFSFSDAFRVLKANAADVLNVKMVRLGLHLARKTATVAEAYGVDCKLGYGGELGLATAAGLHFVSSIPNFDEKTSENHLQLYKTSLVKGFRSENGRVWQVPRKSGLGVDVDRRQIKPFKS